MEVKKLTKELEVVEKELKDAVVTFEDPSYSNVCNRGTVQKSTPVASLLIPNKLYWLWKKKRDLLKSLHRSIPSFTQLLNDRIGGNIIAEDSCSVESRLYKESSRWVCCIINGLCTNFIDFCQPTRNTIRKAAVAGRTTYFAKQE